MTKHSHTCTGTCIHRHVHIHTAASQQAQGECHTAAWRLANISANCQHIVGMQNSWAGAKRSGARTRWSNPSKKDTQNMAPFPMSQEAQHSIGKDIILFSRSQDVHWSHFIPVQKHFLNVKEVIMMLWRLKFLAATYLTFYRIHLKKQCCS